MVALAGRVEQLVVCNPAALALGLRPGLRRSSAQAMAAGLRLARRQPDQEAALLDSLANWALQFSPLVQIDPPAGLLLEIGGCLAYFQGLAKLRQRIEQGLAELGLSAQIAVAPTALAASWLAQAGQAAELHDPALLRQQLGRLALAALPWPADCQQKLTALGLRRLGDLLALPAAGLARRFGPDLPQQLARALGEAPDPRSGYVAAAQFERQIELGWHTEQLEALGFVAKRLLGELAAFLQGRGLGVQQLDFRLTHEPGRHTDFSVGLGRPSRSAEAMLTICREKLGRLVLPASVARIRLRAAALHRLDGEALSLFGDASQPGDFALLLARLAARLGPQAVQGLSSHPDHRPEKAWQLASPGSASPHLALGERPSWLLASPLPLRLVDNTPWHDEPLRLQSRAERIEAGWWDGEAMVRDYYQAQGPSGRRYWIFYQREPAAWFLHGLFA